MTRPSCMASSGILHYNQVRNLKFDHQKLDRVELKYAKVTLLHHIQSNRKEENKVTGQKNKRGDQIQTVGPEKIDS